VIRREPMNECVPVSAPDITEEDVRAVAATGALGSAGLGSRRG
jgi:hypothetical protein